MQLGADAAVAEDLAQETLAEAWRLRDRIYDAAGIERWLLAILRNVHQRWAERSARERSRVITTPQGVPESFDAPHPAIDLEVELERQDLVDLVDRVLAQLPPETRDVLIQRFVEETPIGQLAEQLGLSEGAVQMRLQRGKLALRRVLTTEYADEAMSFGLIDSTDAGWQATRIWCPVCGSARMRGRFEGAHRAFELMCSHCSDGYFIKADNTLSIGVTGFRTTLTKLAAGSYDFWHDGMPGLGKRPHDFELRQIRRVTHHMIADCHHCGLRMSTSPDVHALFLPEGQQFWRENPRIRRVAYDDIEAGGVPAVRTSYQSVTGNARLDVVLTRDSFHVVKSRRS